ncbi:unnamed protein product [Prorocentrum cordatum]|uniref:Uncharacterized protein n=1 Tax=Prorocentrum cordatum TaxID=2364126 RepID=A0ABN9XYA9_9DINO|nr:unnamed protein product [Polarella glacialis]
MEAELVEFERKRFSIVWDPDACIQILRENVTEELTPLPAGSEWKVEWDDEHNMNVLVAADGREGSHWCDDLVDDISMMAADGTIVVEVDGQYDLFTLHEYRKRHKEINMKLIVMGRPELAVVKGHVLQQSVNGAFVLWNPWSICEQSVPKALWKTPPGTWWQNYRRRLVGTIKNFTEFDVEAHLRKAAITGNADDDADNDYRIFQTPAISTAALIRILIRLSNPSDNNKFRKDEALLECWSLFFDAVLRTYCEPVANVEWTVFLDPKPILKPGLPPFGVNKISVYVVAGLVDLTPLFAASDTAPHFDVMKSLFLAVPADERGRVPIQDVLRKLDHGGKQMEWLLQQFVMLTAGMVDGDVVAALSGGAPAGDGAVSVETAPEDLLGLSREHARRVRADEAKKERAEESTDFDPSLCLLKHFSCCEACSPPPAAPSRATTPAMLPRSA